jgi:hypothetical protein
VEVVLELLCLIERIGIVPTVLQAIYAKLIPKHKGESTEINYRAIGLLHSLYRQWARVRREEARRWESLNKSPIMGHQAGRSIMEVVFLQSLRSEAASCQDKPCHTGSFLWHLRNFYECIDRSKLWERARERKLNMAIVAVALNQCGARRFIGLEDLALDCGFPERGIAAGCGWATTWVQVYTLDPLLIWQNSSPQVGLTVFIDDLMGESTAEEEHQVVGRLTHGAASLRTAIEFDLKCEVAAHKSVLVASSDKLLGKLRTAFGRFSGQASQSA